MNNLSSSEEGLMFSWMEDHVQFDFDDQTLPSQIPVSNVRIFSKGLEEDHSSISVGIQPCALVTETKASLKGCTPTELMLGSPESYSDGEDIDDVKWEDELSQVVAESCDREVPNMDEKTKEELVTIPVKEFNIRIKTLKLDTKVLQHLKLCRKRLKNRQAAIRSRNKKENETLFLQRRVNELVREKELQQLTIRQLQLRITEMEKKIS